MITAQAVSPDAASTYETIRFERSGHIGTLTLARPEKHNALNPLMCTELLDLGARLEQTPDLRCLVVTGAGGSFCAGLDLVEGLAGDLPIWAQGSDGALLGHGLRLASTFEWIPRLPFPSVAAIRGAAYGAGCQLALACDFRVVADDARLGLLETRFGLLPDMGGTFRLAPLVGESRARRMVLLGEVVDAPGALRIGLADEVVASFRIDDVAASWARRIAAQPPLAVRGARRAMVDSGRRTAEESLRIAVTEQATCLRSEDFGEALAALREERPPRWTGR